MHKICTICAFGEKVNKYTLNTRNMRKIRTPYTCPSPPCTLSPTLVVVPVNNFPRIGIAPCAPPPWPALHCLQDAVTTDTGLYGKATRGSTGCCWGCWLPFQPWAGTDWKPAAQVNGAGLSGRGFPQRGRGQGHLPINRLFHGGNDPPPRFSARGDIC